MANSNWSATSERSPFEGVDYRIPGTPYVVKGSGGTRCPCGAIYWAADGRCPSCKSSPGDLGGVPALEKRVAALEKIAPPLVAVMEDLAVRGYGGKAVENFLWEWNRH